jgi:glucose/arabinose dehydrogenase
MTLGKLVVIPALLICVTSPVMHADARSRSGGGSSPASTIVLKPVLTGLASPDYVTNARDGSDRLFVVEQGGLIKVLAPGAKAPTVFLDLQAKVRFAGERGLLGLAFHPQFSSNRRFFVDYTRQSDGATVIAEYRASLGDPDVADATETILLVIPQPFVNHNGGMIEFGPDGFFYVAMGDGGSSNDPGDRAQDLTQLLGKILRVDVDHPAGGLPYSVPVDNPFVGAAGALPEIYAYGLRNPFRFSFDRATSDLYAGDVGQDVVEEIDLIVPGGNYGWRVWEGSRCTNNDPGACTNAGFIFPIAQYQHTGGRCAVIGGYAYRGAAAAVPTGGYVYGDLCTGEIFLYRNGQVSVLLRSGLGISSFGEDEAGEIYVVSLDGSVHRIAAAPPCRVTLTPTSQAVSAKGSRALRVKVSGAGGCPWAASANVPWITITQGASGSGRGTVSLRVASNPNAASRTGTVTIGDQVFTVTEAGSSAPSGPGPKH